MTDPLENVVGEGSPERTLSPGEVRRIMERGIPEDRVRGKRILVLTPDSTRTAPLPLMVRVLAEIIAPRAKALDFMVALGTHPPMDPEAILHLYGLTLEEKGRLLPESRFLNHRWDLPDTLVSLGRLSAGEIEDISEGRLSRKVEVVINRALLDYDLVLILGPVFPHEVAGFSGGSKYLFPGVAGGDFLHFTHWLGALVTCWDTIGIADTPVRRAIDRAAGLLPTPRLCVSMVVRPNADLAGLFVGDTRSSWRAAAAVSSNLHVVYKDRPYHTVLGRCPEMYSELWTAGKVMYKLEPVVQDGGRLIIYGPHLKEVSTTWGRFIEKVGYHSRDYFLEHMDKFKDIPLGVLAHSTHVKGLGVMEAGREEPRIEVILATGLGKDTCRKINLGYMNPADIHIPDYQGREDQGILYVEKAGEILHRLR